MANQIKLRRGLKANMPTLAIGEAAFCTDTLGLFIGASGGNKLIGGMGYTAATITVAASNSLNKNADYVCDGTADQTEINAAISALPSVGGEVFLYEGMYNLTGVVTINKNNVRLRGCGGGTVLKRGYNGGNLLYLNNSGCTASNIHFAGDRTAYTSSSNYCVNINSSNCTVNNCIIENDYAGVYSSGSAQYFNVSYNNIIGCSYGLNFDSDFYGIAVGNVIQNYTTVGIQSCSNGVIGNNLLFGGNNGIFFSYSSNTTICGNTIFDNTGVGLSASYAIECVISGNTVTDYGTYGLRLASSCARNNINGNTFILGTGQTADYSSTQYTIQLSGTTNNYNFITNNLIMGKDVVTAGGTGNTITNNKYN